MPTVDFSRQLGVAADSTAVWDVVTDIGLLVGWVSIVRDLEEHEHLARYGAVLEDRLGAFRLRANLAIKVTELDEGRHIRFLAEGEDRQVSSRIQVDGSMDLTPEEGGTGIAVYGTYEVTGRVATLGASMIRTKADKIIAEFVAGLQAVFER